MRFNVLIIPRESTRSQKGVVQPLMVRSGLQGLILWFLVISHASVGDQGSTTFHSHYIAAAQHRNFAYESRIPREFSVHSLLLTWSAHFEPYLDERQWPEYTGPRYITDPGTCWDKRGTRKRTRHKMVMDQVSGRTRRGRASPFLTDPEQNQCGKCGRLGHNSRSCHWPLSQVHFTFYLLLLLNSYILMHGTYLFKYICICRFA
jgi:hypothetical protein